MLQGVRQDFQKGGTKQRTDRIRNQDVDTLRPEGRANCRRGHNAQDAASQ